MPFPASPRLGGGIHEKKTKNKKTESAEDQAGLPDLEHGKSAVLVSLRSPESQRSYRRSIDEVCYRLNALHDIRVTPQTDCVTK